MSELPPSFLSSQGPNEEKRLFSRLGTRNLLVLVPVTLEMWILYLLGALHSIGRHSLCFKADRCLSSSFVSELPVNTRWRYSLNNITQRQLVYRRDLPRERKGRFFSFFCFSPFLFVFVYCFVAFLQFLFPADRFPILISINKLFNHV